MNNKFQIIHKYEKIFHQWNNISVFKNGLKACKINTIYVYL